MVNTQVGVVINVGAASATTGGNTAIGNESGLNNAVLLPQTIGIGQGNGAPPTTIVGLTVSSNTGEASNSTDGSASVVTGDANASGNVSGTNVEQRAEGAIDGLGLVLNTQVAPVVNAGLAVANTGGNVAIGNTSVSEAVVDDHQVKIASGNGAGTTTLVAGLVTGSNDGTASNVSDGSASITSGDGSATGNTSQTALIQEADGVIDGLGVVINSQLPLVANVGLGVANTGGNWATGNVSSNNSNLVQNAEIMSFGGPDIQLVAPFVTGSNSGTVENVSDGTAEVRTGGANATGNASATHLTQDADGHAPGLVLNTQVGGVLNAGVGVANSGGNVAIGNGSTNEAAGVQDADVLSNNLVDADLLVIGPVTAANQGTAGSYSDGTAVVNTGDAQAQGNVSSTFFGQGTHNTVSGLGAGISTQIGGVANVGVGVANSGLNLAIGNASENDAEIDQDAEIASDNDFAVDSTVIGPVTASNSAEATNTSDGSAKVKTGRALATGNASATTLSQHQDDEVTGLGLILGTQVGGVANVGVGVANSGLNLAIGNVSDNDIDDVGGGDTAAEQDADILSDGDPNNTLLLGGGDRGQPAGPRRTRPTARRASAPAMPPPAATSPPRRCCRTSTSPLAPVWPSSRRRASWSTPASASPTPATTRRPATPRGTPPTSGRRRRSTTRCSACRSWARRRPATAAGGQHLGGHGAGGLGQRVGHRQRVDDRLRAGRRRSTRVFAISSLVGGTVNVGVGLATSGNNTATGNDSTNLAIALPDRGRRRASPATRARPPTTPTGPPSSATPRTARTRCPARRPRASRACPAPVPSSRPRPRSA